MCFSRIINLNVFVIPIPVSRGSCDDKMTAVSDNVDLHLNNDFTNDVVSKPLPTIPVDGSGKRQSEEQDEFDEGEQKKCKTNDTANNVEENQMSKRQIKKIQKQQMWLEKKALRKEVNKEKKEKRKKWKAQMREAGVNIQKAKTTKMAESSCKQRVVLDLSYDDMMSDKDLIKCSNQILRCYGLNRRLKNPLQLYFCSYEGKIKETMAKHNGSEYWDINYIVKSFDKVFEKEEIVYLTSDSTNVLDNIDESKVYIIGGLVDHNSCKGASLKVAENLGIAHAKLPIDEYINMKTRKILTINHGN
uniref:tRNA (guanine(9)-N(1))-methyltransferase n=1 Tax=Sipha flava TaxID=143950 RepID=A0A2S2R4G6_9HEMI